MTKEIDIVQAVTVTVDEAKFTPEFMEEFQRTMYPIDSLREHMEHLAELAAAGIIGPFTEFIEGYGPTAAMGIKVSVGGTEVL